MDVKAADLPRQDESVRAIPICLNPHWSLDGVCEVCHIPIPQHFNTCAGDDGTCKCTICRYTAIFLNGMCAFCHHHHDLHTRQDNFSVEAQQKEKEEQEAERKRWAKRAQEWDADEDEFRSQSKAAKQERERVRRAATFCRHCDCTTSFLHPFAFNEEKRCLECGHSIAAHPIGLEFVDADFKFLASAAGLMGKS